MATSTDRSGIVAYIGSGSSLALAVVLLGITVVVFRANAKSSRLSKLGDRAPTLDVRTSLSIFGALKENVILEWNQKVLSVPGRTVEVRLPGLGMIITDNIENIKAIMSTQADCFGKGETYRKIWSSMTRESILTTDGEAWQVNRAHLLPHTGKIRPTDYAVTEKHAQNLISVLSDGKPHDTLDQLNRFAIDVVSDIFCGTSTDTLRTNDQSLRDAIQRHKNRNTWRNLLGKMGARMSPDQEACDVIDNHLTKVVRGFSLEDSESEEERERKAQSLLGVLSAQDVSEKVMKDQIVSVLVGGRDSVAIIVTWALYELLRHPDILHELRAEILSTLPSADPPNASQLEGMRLLNGVVQETMRVHASVGLNTRTALKNCSLPTGGGPNGTSPIGILAGTTLVTALDSVHRNTDVFGPDAKEFKPHRWDNNWKPDPWTFYPFNLGKRVCLGKNLAVMEVKFVLCRLLQAFSSIEMVKKVGEEVLVVDSENEAMRTKMAFNTKPAEVVWLKFER